MSNCFLSQTDSLSKLKTKRSFQQEGLIYRRGFKIVKESSQKIFRDKKTISTKFEKKAKLSRLESFVKKRKRVRKNIKFAESGLEVEVGCKPITTVPL
jgi:hypothetical protein